LAATASERPPAAAALVGWGAHIVSLGDLNAKLPPAAKAATDAALTLQRSRVGTSSAAPAA